MAGSIALHGQNELELNSEVELRLNNETFEKGELSLTSFKKAIQGCKKYKTKRFKKPEVSAWTNLFYT